MSSSFSLNYFLVSFENMNLFLSSFDLDFFLVPIDTLAFDSIIFYRLILYISIFRLHGFISNVPAFKLNESRILKLFSLFSFSIVSRYNSLSSFFISILSVVEVVFAFGSGNINFSDDGYRDFISRTLIGLAI